MARFLSRSERRRIQEAAEQLVGKVRLPRTLSRVEQVQLLAEAAGAPMRRTRYASGSGGGRQSGGGGKRGRSILGDILKALGKAILQPHVPAREIVDAIRLLMDVGYRVDSTGEVAPPPLPPIQQPQTEVRTVPQPGRRRSDPRGPGQIGAPPRPGEESPYGEEILTPQSSNVFSFSYARDAGRQTGTLYVTFKAPKLNSSSVSTGRGRRGGRQQLRGKSGSTVSGKTNERGPMYAYFSVPPAVFSRMRDAVSKGKFVWDNLRIRGTVYGHRYRYVLAKGVVITQDGVSGVYIPRMATKKGFRVRSVATVEQPGRRGFQSSTLAGQDGFRTRRRR